MTSEADDTIAAIASPMAPAPRGIVRLSGHDCLDVLCRMEILDSAESIGRRSFRASKRLALGEPLGAIDVDVMVWPTQRSYTGQPSAELHLMGSPPLLQSSLDAAIRAGARAARPGEFTMRSFLAGRLDLTQAEAVLGVIEAEDRGSLDQALSQLAGNLSRPLQSARSTLLDLLADVEAGLDFVDEDIEFISDEVLVRRLDELRALLSQTRSQLSDRGGASPTIRVVLRGLPNAGKSRLLNVLSRTESAIVTDQAGTTRDLVTVESSWGGHSFQLIDTAGLESREESDPEARVSREAQLQAAEAARGADVHVWCMDATLGGDFEFLRNPDAVVPDAKRSAELICVATKRDLMPADWEGDLMQADFALSSESGAGVEKLIESLVGFAEQRDAGETGNVIGTAARCQDSLAAAMDHLDQAIQWTEQAAGHELVAAEMRLAVEAIGEVTGQVYTDDILDRVFGRFCIGK
ncbi:GTPase and tRNA-U34 5-formylation enzyme TrmE [Rhodopirellula islandica]|uniref:tRNA modification GTPase MnmE n=1 Tax=Rhodopirellula islandica TaxID=595434 RepID=A0A0J1BJL6_RHOIS|nr:tRNA modification GTPase [Rhodopirellula islandica]KLU06623.1 GTPase and tRNA-U34 5-formylation enzyme TrmE [Rhodopirellula islandica]